MSGKIRFIIGNIFLCNNPYSGFQLLYGINQQHRLTMRQDLHNLLRIQNGHLIPLFPLFLISRQKEACVVTAEAE